MCGGMEVARRFEEMVMRRRIPMVVITVHAYVQNDTMPRLLKTMSTQGDYGECLSSLSP